MFWIRLKNTFKLFPNKLKFKLFKVLLTIFALTIADLLGIALFIPLLLLLLKENYIEEYPLLKNIYLELDFLSINQFTILILITIFLLVLIKTFISYYISRYQTKLIFDIQSKLSSLTLDAYLYSDYNYLKKKNSNNIVWEINALPMYFTKFLVIPFITFLNEILITTILAVSLLYLNPKLIIISAIIPIIYIFYRITNKKIQALQQRLAHVAPKLNSIAQQSVFGHIDILLSQTKKNYIKQYDEYLDENKELNTKVFTYIYIPSKLIEVGIISVIIILIIIGLLSNQNNEDTINFLGLFAIAAYRLIPSFNRITVSLMNFKSYQYTLVSLGKTLSLLRNKKTTNANDPLTFNQSIALKNISFSYKKGVPIIDDFSLTINKGDNIGIVGKSGSGKSTLMSIILGVFTSYEGDILVDNQKITSKNINSWFRKIGYVQQNIFLLDGTIRENIAFGKLPHEIDDNKVLESIEKASLTELIDSLPNGINTKVGELGNAISGGQKQRIGIARALYSDSEILLFDEATSALDETTEKTIIETIKKLSKSNQKLTTITIAHKLSSLEYCNKIIDINKTT